MQCQNEHQVIQFLGGLPKEYIGYYMARQPNGATSFKRKRGGQTWTKGRPNATVAKVVDRAHLGQARELLRLNAALGKK